MDKSIDRAATGITGLDEILGGGLVSQRLYLIDGHPGAGKTTLALQYLLAGVRANEKCLYVTLSETKRELEAGAKSHGWSLDGIEVIELIAEEKDFEEDEQLTMLEPSEVELGETTKRIIDAIKRTQPTRMALDSLSELRLLAQHSLRYRRQILALKQFFIGRKCTALLLDDRTSDGPDLQLHSLAHGVIALNSTSPPYGQMQRHLEVVKFRGSDFLSGRHDFTIRRDGVTVFPRLTASQHTAAFPNELIRSGVEELDMLMGGGVDRGTSTLLIGPPGAGKSTIAIQYAIAATQRGDRAVAYLFDETKAAMFARSAGLGVRINEGTQPGELQVQQIDPAAVSPGEFAHMVRLSVQSGARVVVIDSLNGYLNCMPQNDYLTVQLHELLSYLNTQGVTTFLVVAQSGMLSANVTSPINASYLADSIIMLRYFEHAGKVRKAISVVKKRTGAHEDSIRGLSFSKSGIQLTKPLTNLRGVLTGVPIEADSMPASDDRHA